MGISIKGHVKRVLETRQVSDKFSVKEFDIETIDGKYSQVLRLQATNDRISQLDGLNAGDEINVEINLRGREWTGKDGVLKVFNTLDAWKVERLIAALTVPAAAVGGVPQQTSMPEDDIPFASCDLSHEPSPIARVIS